MIDHEFSAIKAHYESLAQVSCCERDAEFLGYARENITARVLLNQEAEGRMEAPSAEEVDEAIAKLKAEHGGEEAFYLKAGISQAQEDLVRQDVAASLRVDRLLREIWGDEIEPAEDAVRAYYDEHLDDFMTAEEVHALHIFKSLKQAENRQRLYDELREVRRAAVAGADFLELAKQHTDKEEKDIDLGFFKQGELMDEFEVIVFSLEVGDVTPVFSSHWGFHLAKVVDRHPAAPKPFRAVEETVKELMIADERQRKTEAFVEELKAKSEIVDAPAVEDDGNGGTE